jgi:hypothetical protein
MPLARSGRPPTAGDPAEASGSGLPPPRSLPSIDDSASLPISKRQLGRTLPADWLAAPVVGKLTAVVDEEAARAGELIRLSRNHPKRELLV